MADMLGATAEAGEQRRLEGEEAEQAVDAVRDALGPARAPRPHLRRNHVDDAHARGAQVGQTPCQPQIETGVVDGQEDARPARPHRALDMGEGAHQGRQAGEDRPQAHHRHALDVLLDVGPGAGEMLTAHRCHHQVGPALAQGADHGGTIGVARELAGTDEEITQRCQGHRRTIWAASHVHPPILSRLAKARQAQTLPYRKRKPHA